MELILFKNARIYSLASQRLYNWLVTCCGKILLLGSKSETIPSLSFTQIIDLQNKTVLPAFGDAHIHSLWMIGRFFEADLSHTRSREEVLKELKQFAAQNPGAKGWIIGRGFNRNRWPEKKLHRRFLDALFPDRPVFLESQDCHSAWVNSEALKRCAIHAATPDPPGGRIEKDASGNPSGLLLERAVSLVSAKLPQADEQTLEAGAGRLVHFLHSQGITHVHTMENFQAFAFWQSYLRRHPRSLRVTIYFQQDELPSLIKAKLRTGFGDEWLQIGGLKLFADGSLGSQTALLSRPYEQSADYYGVQRISEEELLRVSRTAQCNGLAVAVHAIGDRAVEQVLNALKQSENCRKRWGLVSRVEHAQLIRPDLLPLFKQYGLVASMQPVHIGDDVPTAERHWGARSRWAYAFRSLLAAGVPLAFGSDAPVAQPSPLKGIFSAVNRRFRFSMEEKAWYGEESLTVHQAVRAFTVGVALAAHRSASIGTLEPGKEADFIVLDHDPFKISPDKLLSVNVEKTFLAGKEVV